MFEFIRKSFKALNSSGKSWQLSGAIVLAMFAGFLPSNSLILLDLLFIALIINVNFGLFILFSVIFSGIGYLLDPVFESIGYSVLTNDGLNSMFTSMYNSAMWRWSAFNYTLVTGSLVVSLILAVPMMFILNKVVSLYRVQIGQKLNEWKLTRWMKLYNEEDTKSSVFRWWGLGVFGGLATVIVVIFIFVFDPLVRIGMEKGLSYTLETEVNIKDFKSSFSDLKVEVSGIQIADKDKLTHNIVQLDKVAFDLGFSALVQRKAFIENLQVNALAFDEKRAKAATAYKVIKRQARDAKRAKEKAEKAKGSSSSMDIANPFKIPSVDEILANEKLVSVEEAKALKADIEKTKEKWEKVAKELEDAKEVDEIKQDVKKLKKVFKSKDFTKIVSAADDVEKIKKKVKNLKSKYKELQKEFKADQKRIQKRITALKDLPQKDLARLKKKYSLDANGGMNIVGHLVDKEVEGYMRTAMKYYEMVKPYMKKGEEEIEEKTPPRGEGRWIKYANLSNVPDLVIKNAKIGVALKRDNVDITMKNFSSDQKMYKKPMTLHVDANGKNYKHIVGDLTDNRMDEIANTSFDFKMTQFKADNVDMQALSMNNVSVNATFKGSVNGSNIEALSDIDVTKAQLKMGSVELVNELLAGINAFGVDISLDGDVAKPSIGVKSDLDKQLSAGMSKVIAKKAKAFESDLTKGIMGKASGSTDGLSSNLGDFSSIMGDKQKSLDGLDLGSLTGGGKSGGALNGLMNKLF
mgnify:FL=1